MVWGIKRGLRTKCDLPTTVRRVLFWPVVTNITQYMYKWEQFICFCSYWMEVNLLLLNSSGRKCCSEYFCFTYQCSNARLIYDYYFVAFFKLYSLDRQPSLLLHSKIFFHIAALGLNCEARCKVTSDVPGSKKACDGLKSGMVTCSPFLDRCMTTKAKILGPFRGFSSDMEIKNCSSSFFCDASSDSNCK